MDSHEQYLYECTVAMNEICKPEISFLYKEDYIPWLEKYNHLKMNNYHPALLPIIKPQHFNQFYYLLSNMAACLRFNDEASKANEEFNQLDLNNEKCLVDWLCMYEKLSDKIFPVIETNLNSEENPEEFETGFISVDTDYDVKIAVSDYKHVLDFLSNYYDHYWNVVRKYEGLKDCDYDLEADESEATNAGKGLREIISEWEKNN